MLALSLYVARGDPVSSGRRAISATDLKDDVIHECRGGLVICPLTIVHLCACGCVCVGEMEVGEGCVCERHHHDLFLSVSGVCICVRLCLYVCACLFVLVSV